MLDMQRDAAKKALLDYKGPQKMDALSLAQFLLARGESGAASFADEVVAERDAKLQAKKAPKASQFDKLLASLQPTGEPVRPVRVSPLCCPPPR
jgi:hypothetical protein